MKKSIFFFATFLLAQLLSGTFASCKAKNQQSGTPLISDLVLIYHGGTQRPAWTTNQLKPYLCRQKQGNTEWLFDGFLFLEIFDNIAKYEYDREMKKMVDTLSNIIVERQVRADKSYK